MHFGYVEENGAGGTLDEARLGMHNRIARFLPPSPARILVGGGGSLYAAARLSGAGYSCTILTARPEREIDSGGGGFPTVTLEEMMAENSALEPFQAFFLHQAVCSIGPLGEFLKRTRAMLKERGRVIVAELFSYAEEKNVEQAATTPRDVTVAFSEEGFAVSRRENYSAGVLRSLTAFGIEGGSGAADLLVREFGRESIGYEVFVATKDDYRIRSCRDGDEELILEMFPRAFHVNRGRDHWVWKYLENPFGNRMISLAFSKDEKLVAQYCGYPVVFHRESERGNKKLLFLHLGDTMTEKSVRHVGRGPTSILARTARHFFACHSEGKVAVVYGINTGNIQKFSFRFLNGRLIENVNYRVKNVDGTSFSPPGPLNRLVRGYGFERIERFDERWDRFFSTVAPNYRFLLERSSRYLNWRYAESPDVAYHSYAVFRRKKLTGWSVFRQHGENLFWGDGLFDPSYPEAVSYLLGGVLADTSHKGTSRLECWFPDRPAWWNSLLDDLRFHRRPEPDDLGFIYAPFMEKGLQGPFEREYYYTKGDSDLF